MFGVLLLWQTDSHHTKLPERGERSWVRLGEERARDKDGAKG